MRTTATKGRGEPITEPGGRVASPPSPVARWVARLASWRVWSVSAVVYAVYAVAFFRSTATFAIPRVEALCGEPPLDVRFTSDAAEVNGFLGACGSAGRDAYHAMQLADLAYPLVFAVFLASSLALVLTRLAPTRPRLLVLAALPFLASSFDYLENAFAWRALAAFPRATATDGLLGVATSAKTVTSWLAGVLLLTGLAALLTRTALGWRGRVRPSGRRAADGLEQ